MAKFKRQAKNWRLNFQIECSDKQKEFVAQKQYLDLYFDCDQFLFPVLVAVPFFSFFCILYAFTGYIDFNSTR